MYEENEGYKGKASHRISCFITKELHWATSGMRNVRSIWGIRGMGPGSVSCFIHKDCLCWYDWYKKYEEIGPPNPQ